ncbi:MAG: CooT family nickel-binding protein [Holdemanella sp.]|nr:CooT family nickel-binding protein [Holdemanella sp.]
MCLSSVYVIKSDNDKELLVKNIAGVTTHEDGKIVLTNLMGVPTTVYGQIVTVNLMDNYIYIRTRE